jgi:hypothetical protein
MEYSFDRVVMATSSRLGIRLVFVAAFVATIAWHASARADDILDRGIGFHIAPSPLSSALIEFSTQSGLQVAAADADVSHVNSNGVNGTFPPRVALDLLLHGTGLGFSRVGATTVAIGTVPAPAVAASTRTGGSATAARTPQVMSPQPNTDVTSNPAEISDVTVMAARPPTDEELAGNSLSQFVVHHATVRYFNTGVTGSLARWRGGKQSICPATDGLSPAQNAYVTARVRALATYVGAPVDSAPQCKSNVQILFTNHPQENMDAVIKWATVYFRNRYTGGMKDLIAFRGDHAIQGWYMTTRGGAIVLNTDVSLVGLNVLPVWPQITQNYLGRDNIGTRLGGGSESGSGIGIVFLVIDTRKFVNYTIGAITDYLAMLTLSVVQSPDHCDPLPSILDLMSSSCGAREMPAAMTAGDLAFLKALYYKNTGLGPSLSRSEIESNMLRQFKRH